MRRAVRMRLSIRASIACAAIWLVRAADALRALMRGSAIRASHLLGDERVQDPYCLRCQPQVMGAALDVLRQAAQTLAIEANGVTDNPLIFADEDAALSGGNFHAEPVAFAADVDGARRLRGNRIARRAAPVAMLVDPAPVEAYPPS